jgi:hypothetical protein
MAKGAINKLTKGLRVKGRKVLSYPEGYRKVSGATLRSGKQQMVRDATAVTKRSTKKVGKHISNNKGKYGALAGATAGIAYSKAQQANKEKKSVKGRIRKAIGR